MPDIETLSHTQWDCKYQVVCIPQDRRQALYHEWWRPLGEGFRAWAAQQDCRIAEGHVLGEHVPRRRSIPPQDAVAQVVGLSKGQAALHLARTFLGRRKNAPGHQCWARGD